VAMADKKSAPPKQNPRTVIRQPPAPAGGEDPRSAELIAILQSQPKNAHRHSVPLIPACREKARCVGTARRGSTRKTDRVFMHSLRHARPSRRLVAANGTQLRAWRSLDVATSSSRNRRQPDRKNSTAKVGRSHTTSSPGSRLRQPSPTPEGS